MKVCTRCSTKKSLDSFLIRADTGKLRRQCKDCCKNHRAKRYIHNRERYSAEGTAYYKKNKERIKERHRTYSLEHSAETAERSKKWALANPQRRRAAARARAREKPHLIRASAARYRAKKLNATPRWSETEEIKEFYKNCPNGYHVDHVIPLQGKTVSGLHVLGNLQYLTPIENTSKGNRFDESTHRFYRH